MAFPVWIMGVVLTIGPEELAWRYVIPPATSSFHHPPLRALTLTPERPSDVKEKAHYRGKEQRYAQIRYGSSGSVRVLLVVDSIEGGEADLWVDKDRDRCIEEGERLERGGEGWELGLDALIPGSPEPERLARRLVFRVSASGRMLSYAAAGYLEGTVQLSEREVRARRVDGNADGSFTDPQDRFWLDGDGNGEWDPLQEQYLFRPILTFDGKRYTLRSDPWGRRLELEELVGSGALLFKPTIAAASTRIDDLTVGLVGRDGSAFLLQGAERKHEVPVGEYRLNVVGLGVGGTRYTFSESGPSSMVPGGEPKWYRVEKDAAVELDPIGKLDFVLGQALQAGRPGRDLRVALGLYTADGLLINASSLVGAQVLLLGEAGEVLARGMAGFG
ncbi:MAG: hypothetical protein AB1486_21455 [Planctomycetota bacterium]